MIVIARALGWAVGAVALIFTAGVLLSLPTTTSARSVSVERRTVNSSVTGIRVILPASADPALPYIPQNPQAKVPSLSIDTRPLGDFHAAHVPVKDAATELRTQQRKQRDRRAIGKAAQRAKYRIAILPEDSPTAMALSSDFH